MGKTVKAGDVIGYLGMTGYSSKENVNNINVPHLHFGLQLIFDEVQKEGTNQIWIDVYAIINFLRKNRSEVYKAYEDTKDYERKYDFMEENMILWKKVCMNEKIGNHLLRKDIPYFFIKNYLEGQPYS